MQRRHFLRATSALPVLGAGGVLALPAFAAPQAPAGWRQYEITTTVDLAERAGTARVWLPLPAADLTGFQRLLETRFEAPGAKSAAVVAVPGQDTRLLAVEWTDPNAPHQITLVNRIATRDRATDLGANPSPANNLSAAQLRPYLQPTSLAPLDGIVKQTADKILAEAGHPQGNLEKARALYDWMVINCRREGSVKGCGTGDVRFMLTSGDLAGKCADINGLFVALARASGIPARDVYGVRVDDSAHGYKSLGKSGDISRAQHCRADFYVEGYGWVPIDPADVRKVMLEEEKGGLPATDARVRAARALLFGAWEGNWMAYNTGHDIALPGAAQAPAGFLMYPNGET
ncbi:MAG TPA: transglutaminase domain-containing protein, partial [Burkholderiaceae bacterium]